MFGGSWEEGEATVITSRTGNSFAPYADWGTVSAREYVLDVGPVGGAPVFPATHTQTYGEPEGSPGQKLRPLADGEVVRVRFDAKRKKVKFDKSDPRLYKPPPDGPSAFDAAAAAAPGTPAQGATEGSGSPAARQGGSPGDGIRAQFHVTNDPAKIAQLRENFRQMATQNPSSVVRFADPASSSGPASHAVDDLARLADLHDRGVLTDAEFAAEKAKILGEN